MPASGAGAVAARRPAHRQSPQKVDSMKQQKLRVLLDLSLALRGYSGIPQDTRLLFKTLAASPEVEVTGLIYPSCARFLRHRFCKRGSSRGDRLANQACLLWGIDQSPSLGPNFRPWRLFRKFQRFAAMIATRGAQLDPLDVEAFWQVVWRLLFCQSLSPADLGLVRNGRFQLMNVSAETMHRRVVLNRRPVRIDTSGYDFLIVQTARPLRISPQTCSIVRYHDMIPVLQPDTMEHTRDIKWHHLSIRQSLNSFYVCNSEPTRRNLTAIHAELEGHSATIPYVLPDTYWPERNPQLLASMIGSRASSAAGVGPHRGPNDVPRYIMGVSTLEPRKNFSGLIQAYNAARFRSRVKQDLPNLKLLIVGSPGWRYEPILAAMRELVERGDLIHLERVTTDELRVLYSHAEALVYPSHAEGFGFPPLEAMQCDVPVIVSDVPEHRWVMGDAALYCNSYDTAQMADVIERLVASSESAELRAQLIARGRQRVSLYSQERCSSQWLDLLHRLKQRHAAGQIVPTETNDRSSMDRAA